MLLYGVMLCCCSADGAGLTLDAAVGADGVEAEELKRPAAGGWVAGNWIADGCEAGG